MPDSILLERRPAATAVANAARGTREDKRFRIALVASTSKRAAVPVGTAARVCAR